ncbi:hypothetical protein SAT01_40800 [Sinomonas atrocyanea]|nr:hypothetical protein SAT01_40800 [Sinomonas atrocyanea]GGG70191.1 hypothetical protein GCM10007172_23020 [Sinomonas atrocyanea]
MRRTGLRKLLAAGRGPPGQSWGALVPVESSMLAKDGRHVAPESDVHASAASWGIAKQATMLLGRLQSASDDVQWQM